MGFGFTGRSRTKASKAMLSTRPQLQRRAGAGGQKPTRSIVKRWFERCSPTRAANLGSVQCSRCPLPARKIRRHLCRERKALTAEKVRHVNRIKGLLFSHGISGYQPLRRDRRQRLGELQTGDGRAFPQHLKALVNRELNRLELLLKQIRTVEAARDALLAVEQTAKPAPPPLLLSLTTI